MIQIAILFLSDIVFINPCIGSDNYCLLFGIGFINGASFFTKQSSFYHDRIRSVAACHSSTAPCLLQLLSQLLITSLFLLSQYFLYFAWLKFGHAATDPFGYDEDDIDIIKLYRNHIDVISCWLFILN